MKFMNRTDLLLASTLPKGICRAHNWRTNGIMSINLKGLDGQAFPHIEIDAPLARPSSLLAAR